jgi:hypothetical protein
MRPTLLRLPTDFGQGAMGARWARDGGAMGARWGRDGARWGRDGGATGRSRLDAQFVTMIRHAATSDRESVVVDIERLQHGGALAR